MTQKFYSSHIEARLLDHVWHLLRGVSGAQVVDLSLLVLAAKPPSICPAPTRTAFKIFRTYQTVQNYIKPQALIIGPAPRGTTAHTAEFLPRPSTQSIFWISFLDLKIGSPRSIFWIACLDGLVGTVCNQQRGLSVCSDIVQQRTRNCLNFPFRTEHMRSSTYGLRAHLLLAQVRA